MLNIPVPHQSVGATPQYSIESQTQVLSAGGDHCLQTICTRREGEMMRRNADALFIMIGAHADTDWLPAALERDRNDFIRTGRDVSGFPPGRVPLSLETSLPGVLCAGAVRSDSIKRVSSAVGEGSMAIALIHQYLAFAD